MPPPKKRARKDVSSSEGSEYESDTGVSVVEILDSDALDDDTPPPASQISKRGRKGSANVTNASETQRKKSSGNKEKGKSNKLESKYYKNGGEGKNGSPKKTGKQSSTSPSKNKKRKRAQSEEEEEYDDDDDADADDLIEVVGRIVQAPTTGRVPAGQISQNTFNFLKKLQDPKCNDRDWLKLNDPVFRQAEKEWADFVEEFTSTLTEVDDEIPHLPPKDVIHRLYRDVRFSNDKTPYKTNFSASFSRTGRKGSFAHFQPGGGSLFAAGLWCPGKEVLESIRRSIRHDPSQLREVISEPTFESLFGVAKWSKDKRQNIFGGEDQLKVAPKGVAKDHPDIDLLKCRSFAVVHRLKDEQVLAPDFKEILGVIAMGARPFVHRLNHMMVVTAEDDEEEPNND